MTAVELVKAIEARGGHLTLNGEKIRYAIPEDAEDLIECLRGRKPEVIELLKRRAVSRPWPGYRQFRCDLCDTYFDTSSGFARHTVYGCAATTPPTSPATRTLRCCPSCGFRFVPGAGRKADCQTCGGVA